MTYPALTPANTIEKASAAPTQVAAPAFPGLSR